MGEEGHNLGKSPFRADAENEKGEGKDKKESALGDEAAALLAEKQRLIAESMYRTEYPALNAMAARAAYYGVQGKLFPSMGQITEVMLRSGPVGEAAVARMSALANKGWSFGALSPSDSYIKNHASNVLQRYAGTIMLGGYNDAASGRITHNSVMSMVNTVMGASPGADVDAANKYIHELAHGKYHQGYLSYEATPAAREAFAALSPEAQRAHGTAMMQEELRAISAQAASNSRLHGDALLHQNRGMNNFVLESALKQNQLGGLVKDVWAYEGNKVLSAGQANLAMSDYVKSNYAEIFVDGKLNPAAERAIAAEIRRLPVEAPLSSLATAETSFSAPRYMNYLSRGAQGLGSLMVLSAVADVRNQFQISTSSGVARLSSVGSDWLGFEAGAAVGSYFGEGITSSLIKSNPKLAMLALPLCALGSGIVSTQIMHSNVSKPMESKVQSMLDSILKKKD